MEKQKILNTSDEAAQFVTGISGWVDSDGRFWGNDERMARWSGCTHTVCDECGTVKERNSYCVPCHERNREEKFAALERKQWDGETPLYIDGSDTYFMDRESLQDYIAENECLLEGLQLRLCKPIEMRTVEDDYFLEDLHEDAEIPDALADAIAALNKVVDSLPIQTWQPDKYAAVVEL